MTTAAPWQEEMAKTREMAKQYRKVLDETFGTQVEEVEDIEEAEDQNASPTDEPSSSVKKRAISAKSHIFRKGKIETKYVKKRLFSYLFLESKVLKHYSDANTVLC